MSHLDPALLTVIITAGAGLLTGLAQLSVALAAYFRSKANSEKLEENTNITKKAAAQTDGIVSALVSSTKAAAFAEGVKDQTERQAEIQTAVTAAKDLK